MSGKGYRTWGYRIWKAAPTAIGIGGLIVLILSGVRHRLVAWDLSSATSVFGHRLPALDLPGFDADISGIAAYLATAAAVAVAVFVTANHIRPVDVPNPDHRAILSVVAGLIWPVLAIGLIQLAVVAVIRNGVVRNLAAKNLAVTRLAVTANRPAPAETADRHRLAETR